MKRYTFTDLRQVLAPDIFRRAERNLFAQGHVKMNSFFPSVTSLCVSSLQICFSQHLLVRFIRLLYEHYDLFKSYHFQNFQLPKFFRRVGREKIQFSDFFEGEGYFFESCFYSKIGNANIFELIDGTLFSRAVTLFATNSFQASFCQKTAEFFDIFETQT